jgi:GH24 family phage-related lysozyme (muramidase)
MRQITPAARQLIEASEGDKLVIYLDERGVPTGGRGHTGADVTAGMVGQTITQAQSDAWFAHDIGMIEDQVSSVLKHDVNDNEYSALVVFTYNEGIGTLEHSSILAAVNSGDMAAAASDFGLYNKVRVNGSLVVSRGLTIRRHNEVALFLTPADLSAPVIIPIAPEDQTSVQAVAPTLSFWQRVKEWFS